jgi:hypothetical protein
MGTREPGMTPQIERRDAMIAAVEGHEGFEALKVVVRQFVSEDVPLQVLMNDLDQIRGLVSDEDEDSVLDVMDLVVGYCGPNARIGPYSWGDPRNTLRDRWS